MVLSLKAGTGHGTPERPLLLVVMDGVGEGPDDAGNAVRRARTPTLDRLRAEHPFMTLKAHGTAVGLPSDGDMGNSEVGHNAIGAGRVVDQGAKRVNAAIASGDLFEGSVWTEAVQRSAGGSGALHFIGLLSDGNVHSHIDHLLQMVARAAEQGVKRLYVHALADGRDVGKTTALEYVDRLEGHLARFDGSDGRRYRIASGGGRMKVTMDRYEADWAMVKLGWRTHVWGEGRRFSSAREAIEVLRAEEPGVIDQNLPPFVVADGGAPVGPIRDGDAVIFFNFRGDRAIELSRAFDDDDFSAFDRGPRPDVLYAGMMEYDGDLKVPRRYLVDPPAIDRTMGAYLAAAGVPQFACSETQKFGHVTYFWNGNRSGMFDPSREVYREVPSDRLPFEERPWMKAAEITDATVAALAEERFGFLRINFANGDMVGHTGHLEAATRAVEAVDFCLLRLIEAMDRARGLLLVTADHGNAEEMVMRSKDGRLKRDADGAFEAKTSHSLNPVPLLMYDARGAAACTFRRDVRDPGLGHLAATCLDLLGFHAPEGYLPTLLQG